MARVNRSWAVMDRVRAALREADRAAGRYNYKGWQVYDQGADYHPTTGRWQAWRFGVRIGHNTEAGLRSMIDNRGAGL